MPLERLPTAGVTVAADGYGIDGFDDAERLGLRLPCLALAYDMNGRGANDDAELALRRLAPQVPAGTSIGALSAFRDLMAREMPDVDVDHLTGPLSPAWVELPLGALDAMTSGTPPHEGLDVDALVTPEPEETWWFLPGADLVWISDDSERDGAW